MLPKVMIIEDDDVIREVYTLKFELEGYRVCVAENGQLGLDRVGDFSPDIILLDMMMPVMGGLEFMQTYKNSQLGTHVAEIIVFSNISAPQQMSEVLNLGAVEYWVKSDFTPDQLVKAVGERWQKQPSLP